MSQSADLTLSNQLARDFRLELNNILQAIASNHLGGSAPSYAVEGMGWVDNSSTPWVLKKYVNGDWAEIGTLHPTSRAFLAAGVKAGSIITNSVVDSAITAQKIAESAINAAHISADAAADILTKLGINLQGATAGQVLTVQEGGGLGFSNSAAEVKTGRIEFVLQKLPDVGWIFMQGQSLGTSGSGADLLGSEYEALYIHFWNELSDNQAPVSSGRGASALADWTAGKVLTMPNPKGLAMVGAGQGDGLSKNWALGEVGGEESHTLTENEMFPHDHDSGTLATNSAGGHTHSVSGTKGQGESGPYAIGLRVAGDSSSNQNTNSSGDHNHTVSGSVTNTGGGDPFNVIQPSIAVNWMVKL